MEPGLEEEEEVDPRIQVGRAGVHKDPGICTEPASQPPPPTPPPVPAPGGGGSVKSGAGREGLSTRFPPVPGRLRCPRGRSLTLSPGFPGRIRGSQQRAQRCGRLRNKEERGRGRHAGVWVPGWARGAAGFGQPPGSGSRAGRLGAGSRGGGRRRPLQVGGHPCLGVRASCWQRCPA